MISLFSPATRYIPGCWMNYSTHPYGGTTSHILSSGLTSSGTFWKLMRNIESTNEVCIVVEAKTRESLSWWMFGKRLKCNIASYFIISGDCCEFDGATIGWTDGKIFANAGKSNVRVLVWIWDNNNIGGKSACGCVQNTLGSGGWDISALIDAEVIFGITGSTILDNGVEKISSGWAGSRKWK